MNPSYRDGSPAVNTFDTPTATPVAAVPGYLVADYRRFFSMAQKRGHAWGKSDNLARLLGVSLRTFRYHVAALREHRWIATATNGRMIFIWPLVPCPPEHIPAAPERDVPAPPVPVPPIALLVAQTRRVFAPRTYRRSADPAMQERQQTPPPVPAPTTPPPAPEPVRAVVAGGKQEKKEKAPAQPEPEADPALVAQISEKGVREVMARRLAADNPDECRRQLAWLPLRKAQDTAALLVAAILGRFGPPRDTPQKASDGPNTGDSGAEGKWYVGDGDRARARHLGQIPPALWPGLEEKATRYLREVEGWPWFSRDALAERMAKIWRDGENVGAGADRPCTGAVRSAGGNSEGKPDAEAIRAAIRAKVGLRGGAAMAAGRGRG